MMNIVDYIVGNTDRHLGNWGVLVNNSNNKPVRLYDLMNFKQALILIMMWMALTARQCFGNVLTRKKQQLNQLKELV